MIGRFYHNSRHRTTSSIRSFSALHHITASLPFAPRHFSPLQLWVKVQIWKSYCDRSQKPQAFLLTKYFSQGVLHSTLLEIRDKGQLGRRSGLDVWVMMKRRGGSRACSPQALWRHMLGIISSWYLDADKASKVDHISHIHTEVRSNLLRFTYLCAILAYLPTAEATRFFYRKYTYLIPTYLK